MAPSQAVEVIASTEFDTSEVSPPNTTWEIAFYTDRVLVVRARLGGGDTSGWHTFGEHEVYGVVIEGRARFEYGSRDKDSIDADTGDFFHIPAEVVHRNVNPTGDEQVIIAGFVGSGMPVVSVKEPPLRLPAREPRVAGTDDLIPTGILENLTRLTPFPDAAVQQIRGHATGRIESSWHHHGDNDVFGYVLNGEGYVEWGLGDGERKIAHAGDFFHIPPGLVHRDVNPSDDEQDYLLWLTGTEPRVVHVDEPANSGE
ncbi:MULTISPECIES: cupin domain-containing protein [Haloferax]|uniref:Cupin domain-containing protein n=2 Tax=Haloferax TaxID=2251 RepID=A0A6G1Z6M5_9EURY|nr:MULTISPECIES: cupin domain-containing protein [Haloferax]KAB1185110.1 cupin domain-containing protein [Haloferax sp. CBA1149]MRW82287.1 cupin domain-containing protein [Haloferax marinisediminis]